MCEWISSSFPFFAKRRRIPVTLWSTPSSRTLVLMSKWIRTPYAMCTHISFPSLRAISRGILASGQPGIASTFTTVARARLQHTNARSLEVPQPLFRKSSPTGNLRDTLTRARSVYGAGMGFASLGILTEVVRATIGLRWDRDGDMVKVLSDIDTDISQAIQVGGGIKLLCRSLLILGSDRNRAPRRKSKGAGSKTWLQPEIQSRSFGRQSKKA